MSEGQLSLSCHGVALGMCNRKPCVKKNFWVRQSLRNDFVPVCNAVVIHRVYRVFIVGVHTDYESALHTYNMMVRFILCKESCVFVWVWVCNKDASLCTYVRTYVCTCTCGPINIRTMCKIIPEISDTLHILFNRGIIAECAVSRVNYCHLWWTNRLM